MPKIDEVRRFTVEPTKLMKAIRLVASSFGWRVMLDELSRITIKEDFAKLNKSSYAAELAISVTPDGDGAQMVVNGSIFGIGPILKNRLKGLMGRFLNEITTSFELTEASATTDSVASSDSVADEVKKLADLHSQGLLTDGEFATAKAKLLG